MTTKYIKRGYYAQRMLVRRVLFGFFLYTDSAIVILNVRLTVDAKQLKNKHQ